MEKVKKKCKVYNHYKVHAWMDEDAIVFTIVGIVTFATINCFVH
jgi:hypothetical protein